MIKQITSKKNLNEAYLRVYRNKGAAGVDNIQVTELKTILKSHGKQYAYQIERELYQVFPILGVEIPKSNGSTRLLGIPTVVDRVYQQASLHSRKTKEVGRVVAKPFKVLHMDRLEETRKKKEEPYPTWNRPRKSLCMESNKNGWLGSCTISYFTDYNYHKTLRKERLY